MKQHDLNTTILSQYANSPRIRALIDFYNSAIDPATDIDKFFNEVFNILTATTWGLDVWGRRLGIGRNIEVLITDQHFGFDGSNAQSFNQYPFYFDGVSSVWPLTDEPFRQLLMLKAMANISDTSIPSLNDILAQFFQDKGRVYVVETGIMQMRYVFEMWLQPWERSLMRRRDIPPKPAGVGFDWIEAPPSGTFGFLGSKLQPFNQGTFSGGIYVPS